MEEPREQCYIYIDDSNLFIEGMKYLARKLSLRVKQDHRFRIEPESFVKVLARNRSVMKVTIYGSGRLQKQSFWRAWRESGVQTKVFERCLKGQEKEVDSTLAADLVDKAACLRFRRRGLKPRSVTFIVVSGDRDYLQALRKVLKHRWKLEVVGWSNSVSKRVREFVQNNEGASLINLDNLVNVSSIYFIELRYSCRSKSPRSGFVFKYLSKRNEDAAKALSFQVAILIKRPCQYYRNDKEPYVITVVLLVPYTSETMCHEHEGLLRTKYSDESGLCITYESTLTLEEPDQDSETDDNEDDQDNEDESDDDDDKDEDKEKPQDNDDCDDDSDDDSDDENDNDDDEEQMKKERLEEEKAVKRGDRCVLKYRCSTGKRCLRYHTKSEKKHFSSNGRHLGKLYKSVLCWSAKNPAGTSGKPFKCPKMCPFAHSLKEARCYHCDPGGLVGEHWMDNCPKILYERCAL